MTPMIGASRAQQANKEICLFTKRPHRKEVTAELQSANERVYTAHALLALAYAGWAGGLRSPRPLEVLKPPIVSLCLERSKPPACEIQQRDCYPPYQIKKWETPDVTFRWLWIAHRMVGEEPWADYPKPDL